jgi:shikimate kinase
MNIVLLGFMGTGKTTVARKLSEILGLKYISTDGLIEEREKRTINEIFTHEGEEYFRKIEKEIVKEVAEGDGQIIDAGGGVVLDSRNIEALRKNGILICLTARPEVILERTKDKNDRPLLNVGDKLEKINQLLEYRKPFYDRADYFIDTSDLNIEDVVKKILEIIAHINT